MIALIVTIIVLLILAGITVATLTGDNGLLTKAGEAKNASEQANLEEEVQLALIEGQTDKYFNSNSNMEEKLKAIFEKSYGQGNIDVTKAGKNYKAKVKNTKTAYRIKANGTVEKYEEMNPTEVYARLDDDGTLYLRATQGTGYNVYTNSNSIQLSWNTAGNATKASVTKVVIEEPIAPTSGYLMFVHCTKLQEIQNIEYLHTENINNMNNMFCNCGSLQNLNVSRFDTSNVTDMGGMFSSCNSLQNIDVSNFDTSNVINMGSMFYLCSALTELDVSGFDTSKIQSMGYMFIYCSKLANIDVTNFNTDNVTNMEYMFFGCNSLKEINVRNFDTKNVTKMNSIWVY